MRGNISWRAVLVFSVAAAILAIPAGAADTDGTWTLNNNGDWSDAATGNWQDGIVADGIGYSAYLSNVISSNRNITLNGNRTIGNIHAQDTSHNYSIIGASTLTLDASSGQSILEALSGRTLTISTPVTVNDGLQKDGAGNVTFGGPITLGGAQTWTNNSSGQLLTGNGANLITNGGFQLTIDGSGRTTLGVVNNAAVTLSGTGALVKNGTGVLSIGGNNSAVFSGNVTVNGGLLHYGDNVGSLGSNNNILITDGVVEARWSGGLTRAQGTGSNEIQITGGISGFSGQGSSAATFNIGNVTWGSSTFNPTEFVLQSPNTNVNGKGVFANNIDLAGDDSGATPVSGVVWRTIRSNQTGYDFDGYGQFSGNITNSGTTNLAGLIKTGIGQHILSGTNTYDGGTTVNEGTLTVASTGALPGYDTSGKVTVAGGAMLAVRTNSWTAGDIDTLRGAATWSATTSQLGFDTNANFTYASDITEALSVGKFGGSTLTLSGNNSYTGATTIYKGTLVADSATALGTGDITFKGGTLQYTANTAATDFGSRIANSTSAISLNTNGQNVGISGIANTNTGGLTKSGAGTLTLTGTNSYSGTTTIGGGSLAIDGGTTSMSDLAFAANTSMSIINGGTLNTSATVADDNVSNTTWSIIGGSATSTWNLGNANLYLFGYSPEKENKDLTIDGAGVANSAVLTNVQNLQWGKSTKNSDLLVTDGGLVNVNKDVQIGSTYYGTAGINNTITIQGGTADSVMNVGQDYYIGFGDRPGASSNTTTVSDGGQLNITRDTYVGHVNYNNFVANATANQLTVTGSGTAGMKSLSVGYVQNSSAAVNESANANVVEVTNGGKLSTTGGTSYIGRANSAGSIANSNTVTVSGAGSSWDAGNQAVYVGYTNNATAQSNNNILTVGTGGVLTNVGSLIVGSGSGTETGNQVVLNGGTISATTVTVSSGNTLGGTGSIAGALTVNSGATLAPGASTGTLTVAGDTTLPTGSFYEWQVGQPGETDILNITSGTLTLGDFTLKILDADGYVASATNHLPVFTYSTGVTLAMSLGSVVIDPSALGGTWHTTTLALTDGGLVDGVGTIYLTGLSGGTADVVLGDSNEDGVVDAADFITLKKNFGLGGDATVGNFDGSATVDWTDLSTLMANMGVPGNAPATTPEPCSAMLLVFGAAALLRRRRK